jgi:ribosomal protein S18 acetylase RimI-like enzyme
MPSDHVFTLRTCGPGDEYALSLIGRATFLESFAGFLEGADLLAHCRYQHAAEKYLSWLESSQFQLCVAEVKQAPVGYVMLCPPDVPVATSADDIEVKRIYMLHRFQGSGIGKALMDWAVQQAKVQDKKRLLLGVNTQNHEALAFYARTGFEKIGTRQFLVGSKLNDDYILARNL